MVLIVGLGNPGKKSARPRHNIGFMVIEEFKRKNLDKYHFSDFKFIKTFNSLISEGILNGKKIILAKPQTFMNVSGKAVKILIENGKLKIENLIVIHDDLDLPLGKIRVVKGRGSAGHKGVESIIKELETKNFIRFRIGIQPIAGKPKNVEKFVLQKFNKTEGVIVKEVIKNSCLAIREFLEKGLERAMMKYNL